jgi:ferredoxin
MTYLLIHNQNECIGCNACANVSSKFFKMNDDTAKAELVKYDEKENDEYKLKFQEEDLEILKECAQSCPVNCIKIETIKVNL